MDALVNPVARKIYLTYPADCTFKEVKVSNYLRYSFLKSYSDVLLQCYVLIIVLETCS